MYVCTIMCQNVRFIYEKTADMLNITIADSHNHIITRTNVFIGIIQYNK